MALKFLHNQIFLHVQSMSNQATTEILGEMQWFCRFF